MFKWLRRLFGQDMGGIPERKENPDTWRNKEVPLKHSGNIIMPSCDNRLQMPARKRPIRQYRSVVPPSHVRPYVWDNGSPDFVTPLVVASMLSHNDYNEPVINTPDLPYEGFFQGGQSGGGGAERSFDVEPERTYESPSYDSHDSYDGGSSSSYDSGSSSSDCGSSDCGGGSFD
jgi:hypothetical protein